MRELVDRDGGAWDDGRLVQLLADDAGVPPRQRPWVSTNMVMSLDGAYAVDGTSRGLSSDGDRAVFLAQRALADAVLVGAATARVERYRRPTATGPVTELRRRRGQRPAPLLVVVSTSCAFPDDQPFLAGDGFAPLVAHPARADASALPREVEGIACGEAAVDLSLLVAELHARGVRWLHCEGGPGLLGQLAAADLVDEFMLTLSPHLVGGTEVGILGPVRTRRGMHLHRSLRDGEHLLLDYRRD